MNKSAEDAGSDGEVLTVPSLAHLFMADCSADRTKRLQVYQDCLRLEDEFSQAVWRLLNPERPSEPADGPTVAQALLSLWVLAHRVIGQRMVHETIESVLPVREESNFAKQGQKRPFAMAEGKIPTSHSPSGSRGPAPRIIRLASPKKTVTARGKGVSVRGGRGAAKPPKKLPPSNLKVETDFELPEIIFESDDE